MTEKRSQWFNAMKQPPLNGGRDDRYERRCKVRAGVVWMSTAGMLRRNICPHCQWRGLLREDGGKA